MGRLRPIERRGRTVQTGIWKTPVEGAVEVRGVSVAGDEQADKDHGGPDQAVYAYAREDYAWWEAQLGRELAPGTFGENLVLSGVDVSGARIGERWEVGTCVLEVSGPRIPCWKLGIRMNDSRFVKRFGEANRPGAYLRIVEEGRVGAGDRAAIVTRPDHEVTVALVSRVYLGERHRAADLLGASALTDGWRRWAVGQAGR